MGTGSRRMLLPVQVYTMLLRSPPLALRSYHQRPQKTCPIPRVQDNPSIGSPSQCCPEKKDSRLCCAMLGVRVMFLIYPVPLVPSTR